MADIHPSFREPIISWFYQALPHCPHISIDASVMAGSPCIKGTRIPVYGILDALEEHGSVEGVLESYPHLTVEQVQDAIAFAKLVVECAND